MNRTKYLLTFIMAALSVFLFVGCNAYESQEIPNEPQDASNYYIPSVSALPPLWPPWGFDALYSGDFAFRILPCETAEIWHTGFWYFPYTTESIIVIPSEVEGYAVTRIGRGVISSEPKWNSRFGQAQIIVIPESVTSIDDVWFDYEYAQFRREHLNAVDNIIYGYPGSFAEKFASEADILFIPLDAEFPLTMFMSNHRLEFDTPPFIEEDIIFVPLRFFFENIERIQPLLEARNIIWDDETQTVTIDLYDWFGLPPALFETVKVTVGSDTFSINSDTLRGSLFHNWLQIDTFELEAPPRIVNNRVFVPLSFFIDYFGFAIDYDCYFRVFDIRSNLDSNIPYARSINEIRPRQ